LLKFLIDLWVKNDKFIKVSDAVSADRKNIITVNGLDGSALNYFIAGLTNYCRRPALIVVSDVAHAEKTYSELQSFFPDQVNLLRPRDLFINTDALSRSDEHQQSRLGFLEWLHSGKSGIYVAPVAALVSKSLPPAIWHDFIINLQIGMNCDREDLLNNLVQRGYERVVLTESRGHFSARGDIIDIFPPGRNKPVRIELFDDIIESIRHYDPQSQRSTDQLQKISILPARELLLTENIRRSGNKVIERYLDRVLFKLRKRGEKDLVSKLKRQVSRHLERLANPEGLDFLSSYFPFFYGAGSSLLDYMSSDYLVFIAEPENIAEKISSLHSEFEDYSSSALIEGDLLIPEKELLWKEEELFSHLRCPLVALALLPGMGEFFKTFESINIDAKSAPFYHGKWDLFKNDYQDWISKGYSVYFLAESKERANSLLDLTAAEDVSTDKYINTYKSEGFIKPQVITGSLEQGIIIPELQLAIITERNLLPVRKKKRRLKHGDGIRLSDYRELASGDYVVHEQHGIGKYLGLNTLEVSGSNRDYLVLKYRGTDKLYIPVDQVGLIQKYSGGDGPVPRLHSLGGNEWQRLKSKVNRSVEKLARELLALYAARKAVEGYSFGPEHPWQKEFEAHFPFEETPDQLKTVRDVKSDMEKNHPMDRLVCGDVGYGKTEVAMRAAFKAVMEGKQVAVLVPTTVLAQQHFRTFSERFEKFPVNVFQLSRFVSASNQKEIIKALEAGKVDIVIGTHRLLSRDVRFYDLGLLVIDEEQRFGVRQKEKIKQLRLEVDTLAMTATPIPRTLHLSLAGARDFSIIDTPPEDRYPVQTYVLEYSENLVRDAVQRELSRGGQVFIVFNRVERIDSFANKIQNLFPKASVAVGHGQLPEASLERIMADFQEGKYQILVSTTIIESGLDIPNVNTLIIDEADRFGLAQLYQIRGRVGRSSRLAYAYLTYRKDKLLSETAKKRLKAIKEFTELGSGFKVALRDLEIRGAGNILGTEQHGFIAAVGFDLYVRLLDRAVAELKNKKHEQKIEPRFELKINAHLPSAYISAQEQKVEIYQRVYNSSAEELSEIEDELKDRFGAPPQPVKNLLKVAGLRLNAAGLGIELIAQKQNDLTIQFARGSEVDPEGLKKQISSANYRVTLTSRKPAALKIKGLGKSVDLLEELNRLLKELYAYSGNSAVASGR